ncbi:hypothetical protein ANOBCDAF_00413 [Pleomorphomonas sp. T1.2MG-36]|nr:hypothetical protein ANOBCDAF_00413 [Pleomorphomonas sp. T1.2MG-36]
MGINQLRIRCGTDSLLKDHETESVVRSLSEAVSDGVDGIDGGIGWLWSCPHGGGTQHRRCVRQPPTRPSPSGRLRRLCGRSGRRYADQGGTRGPPGSEGASSLEARWGTPSGENLGRESYRPNGRRPLAASQDGFRIALNGWNGGNGWIYDYGGKMKVWGFRSPSGPIGPAAVPQGTSRPTRGRLRFSAIGSG